MLLTKTLIVTGLLLLLLVAFVAMRKDRFRHGSTLGNALQEAHAAFDPGVRNAIEARQQQQVEEDESGEPPSDEE